ncbi:MAG: aldehyde dehydrogenase family protein [Candidatus Marinimicrobia bacterium]|nr:aldehyde dehydrogenase family protein [Candidatus Neomarinimicrobiota bacterium]
MSAIITNQEMKCYNPATGKHLENVPISTSKQIEETFLKSKSAAKSFNLSTISQRKTLMNRFRKAIVNRMDDFIQTICSETGKKQFEAMLEVMISADLMKNQSKHAKKALASEKRSPGIYLHKRGKVEHRPFGVAGIISPWNYPLILTISPVAEALLAGNTVVLKPSEQTPLTSILLKKIFDSIADNPDIFQILPGAAETGKAIVESKYADIICFTGSTAIGKIIAQSCGERLKPCILELGGKDAMIVLEDANLKRAAKACIWGGFSNAGQTCISIERVYVCESVFERFVELLKKEMANLTCGPNPENRVGAMTMKSGLAKVKAQIQEAESKGCAIYSIPQLEDATRFIPPTLVFDPPEDLEICSDETFGPVISIHKVEDEKEAIERTNQSQYGLAANIFTKNKRRGRKIASKIQAGMICINDALIGYALAELPFGGMKDSGIGRVHGLEGLKAFSQQVSIVENRITLGKEFWWYDLSEKFHGTMKKIIRFWYG